MSKLSAARLVAEAYGLPLSECAMVGDGENDLELLRAVGVGIAMGNAPLGEAGGPKGGRPRGGLRPGRGPPPPQGIGKALTEGPRG